MTHSHYSIIKKHIDRYDYMDLLAGGCPDDEFDSESRMVAARISVDSTAEEIAGVLAEVFTQQFGQHEEAGAFLELAGRIKKDIG